jgi:hypothetical protein
MATDYFPGDLKGLQDAPVNAKNIEQFLREMAVLATQAVGSDLSCAIAISPGARPPGQGRVLRPGRRDRRRTFLRAGR